MTRSFLALVCISFVSQVLAVIGPLQGTSTTLQDTVTSRTTVCVFSITEAAERICRQYQVELALRGNIVEIDVPQSLVFYDPPTTLGLEANLDRLAKTNGAVWYRRAHGAYELADEEWYRSNVVPCRHSFTRIIKIQHGNSEEIAESIRPHLDNEHGWIMADRKTNKIVFSESSQERLEEIKTLILTLDQPLLVN